MKTNKELETLLQKIIAAKNKQERALLVAILKNKYPDVKVPR